jgi:diguanylate cyclase (GGDEF)-like protein/PAS domain S-box-containing protein
MERTMSATLPKPLIFGFAVALVTLLGNALLPQHYVSALIDSQAGIERSLNMADHLSTLRIDITDAETGQRGFLLTRNAIYLQPYQRAIEEARTHLLAIKDLVADNNAQLRREQRVEELLGQKFGELKQTIDLAKSGHEDEALRVVMTDRGNTLMQSLRDLINQIDEVEDLRYAGELRKSSDSARSAISAFIITALIDAGMFVVVFFYAIRLFRSRVETEAAASRQSIILRAVLDSMHDGVIVADQDGNIAICNPAAERLLGRRVSSLQKDRPYELRREDGSLYTGEEVPLARSLKGEIVVGENIQLVASQGEPVWLSINSTPIIGQDDSRFGGVAVFSNISARKQAETELLELNEQLSKGLTELSLRNAEISQLGELTSILQSCRTEEEACDALMRYANGLFNGTPGALYLMVPSKNYLELTVSWRSAGELPDVMAPDECWALRRGKTHKVLSAGADICCGHISRHVIRPDAYLCIPMSAQGEAIGVLFLQLTPAQLEYGVGGLESFAAMVAEQCGLALSNLRLREQLRFQSMHDPLTGLFNRRFLEASLELELNKTIRKQEPLTVAMMDLDHFKRFNDTFGHDAGDALLRAFGGVLRAESRASDIICRYGGEEFLLILPETTIEYARQCIERLLLAVRRMEVHHGGKLLGSVTISVGLASYPPDGDTATALVQRADAALYQAKSRGRDQIAVAE